MTRHQAADRLRRMGNLRDAKIPCEMGAAALTAQPWVITVSVALGFLLGVTVVGVLL